MEKLFNKLQFSYILKKIRKTSDFDYLIDYMEKTKNYMLPTEAISDIVDMLCTNPDEYYIYTLSSRVLNFNVDSISKLSSAMLKTDSSSYIMKYMKLLNEKNIHCNNYLFIKKLCELGNLHILKLLLDNINLSDGQRFIILKTIIKNDSLENILSLTRKIDNLTIDEKKFIVNRVCCDADPYYICLFSILFSDVSKHKFINAMVTTNNPELLYCFIKYNKNLDVDDINVIVDRLCSLDDIDYVYKTLDLVYDEKAKYKLLKKINDFKDLKYLCLAYFHTDGIENDEKFNFNKLYPYMIDSNLYTPNELVDAYKVYMKRKENN